MVEHSLVNRLAAEVLGVALGKGLPLLRQIIEGEDG